MSDYLLSVLFGIVEGVTEFLPISSTAHLRIAQAMAGISLEDGYWKMYAVVIQLGAILSVLVYFRKRIWDFVGSYLCCVREPMPIWQKLWRMVTHPLMLTAIACVVTVIPVMYLKKKGIIDDNLESLWIIGTSLMVGGVIMWGVDVLFRSPRTTKMEGMTLWQAVWIGAAQILSAAFPGTSRSMSTIAAGQVAGMSREAALEFSFFLSIPIMIAATGKELYDTVFPKGGAAGAAATQAVETAGRQLSTEALHLTPHQWGVLAVGFVVSFLVAWGVIAWFMAWVRKHGFVPFAVYRIALGVYVLFMAQK